MRTTHKALRLLSQLRTVAAPFESDMKHKLKKSETMHNETIGRPLDVVRAMILGA